MYYYAFNRYLKDKFSAKVWKVSLNAGFGCPNKNGVIDSKGCVFCNEEAFSRLAGSKLSLQEQLEEGIGFAREKGVEKFIVYFQNGTSTNAPIEELKRTYDVIKSCEDIVGLSISTRPDCVDDAKIGLISEYVDSYDVWIEYGLQTVHNKTLKKINRRHTFDQSAWAIEKTARKGVNVGVHVILGLPGETRRDMINTAKVISGLPVNGVKFHILHVLKDTHLARLYDKNRIKLLDQGEYIDIACDFLENLRKDIVILRLISDAKRDVLIGPEWMNSKLNVMQGIEREFSVRGTGQGSLYK